MQARVTAWPHLCCCCCCCWSWNAQSKGGSFIWWKQPICLTATWRKYGPGPGLALETSPHRLLPAVACHQHIFDGRKVTRNILSVSITSNFPFSAASELGNTSPPPCPYLCAPQPAPWCAAELITAVKVYWCFKPGDIITRTKERSLSGTFYSQAGDQGCWSLISSFQRSGDSFCACLLISIKGGETRPWSQHMIPQTPAPSPSNPTTHGKYVGNFRPAARGMKDLPF